MVFNGNSLFCIYRVFRACLISSNLGNFLPELNNFIDIKQVLRQVLRQHLRQYLKQFLRQVLRQYLRQVL